MLETPVPRVLETMDRLAAETGQALSVLRGSLVLDRLVALVLNNAWPEFVDPPQWAPRPLPPSARTVDPALSPAASATLLPPRRSRWG